MSDHSAIQWTDATWNPTTGCTKVSPGCAHCYIERTPAFRIHGRKFVNGATDLRLHTDRLEQPLHWRTPRRVFVNSLSDLFHDDVPDAFIDRVFAVMSLSYRHRFQILTKRPERMRAYVQALDNGNGNWYLPRRLWTAYHEFSGRWPTLDDPWPLGNVWLGVSVENQHFADERIPLLLQTPAAVRFISAEPLLGPVLLGPRHSTPTRLDWVIVGGESGPKSRAFSIEWARSVVKQCEAARVSCFVKQLGSTPVTAEPFGICGEGLLWRPNGWPRGTRADDDPRYPGVLRIKLRDKKGGDPAEWPADLRVREFPPSEGV